MRLSTGADTHRGLPHEGKRVDVLTVLLNRHKQGLRTDQLLRQYRLFDPEAGRRDIARLLGQLHRRGLARIGTGRRWRLIAPQRASSESDAAPVSGRGEAELAHRIATVPFSVTHRGAGIGDAVRPAEERGELPSGWDLFRALAHHYAASLRREELPAAWSFADRAGTAFVLLQMSGRWWPEEQEEAVLSAGVADLAPAFREALTRRGDEDLALGYPIRIMATRSGPCLRPVATLACRRRVEGDRLVLEVSPQRPGVDGDWLRRRPGDAASRQRLEAWLGLREDEDAEDGRRGSFLDIGTLADRLRLFAAGEMREPLDPALPQAGLALPTEAGIYNLVGLFLLEPIRYGRGAIADLRDLAAWPDTELARTALAAFYGGSTTPTVEQTPVLEPLELTENQLKAARDALHAPLTIITGPPGTGKSQTAAAIMASTLLQNGSVLLGSRNHKALDAVEERLLALSPDVPLLARINRRDSAGASFSLLQALDAMLSRPEGEGARPRLARRARDLSTLEDRRRDAERRLFEVVELGDAVAELEEEIDALEEHLGPAAATAIAKADDVPALPRRAASSRLEGLPVVGRWVRRRRRHRAATALARLDGVDWASWGWPHPNPDALERCLSLLDAGTKYRDRIGRLRALELRLRKAPDRRRSLREVVEASTAIREASATLLHEVVPQALDEIAESDRSALVELRQGLRLAEATATSSAERARLWAAHGLLLLRHFPLWAVTNLSARRHIPMVPGLFDLVIIDEASQCDIASALPLLARARRAVIIGDPAQLAHVTKMPLAHEVELLRGADLHHPGIGGHLFTTVSLYDLAASRPGTARHLLRDHFRSHPDIAAYISNAFYRGRLHVLTREEALRPPLGMRPGLHWSDVRGAIEPAASGCHAPAEVDAILATLRELLVERGWRGSVGVVTPFAEQARRLADRIVREVPAATIAETGLVAATAHQLQGDARDLILFSLCLGPGTPPGSRAFLRDNRYLVNVAVSRARAVCHVVGNLEGARESGIPHLQELARAAVRRVGQRRLAPAFESPWERRLYEALQARGIEAVPQYPIAGRRLDLAIVTERVRLDVEVDGDRYHRDADGRRRVEDLWRDHQLESLGWRVARFWVYELREDIDGCVERISAILRGPEPTGI